MKLWLKLVVFVSCIFLLAACGEESPEKVVKKLEKEWGNVNGYSLVAKMNMQSGAQTKQYNVEVWHTKPDFYRVQVNEKDNEATQVIVKNDEGVFVVSPSLNKTYEFQSDWPNKNSQAYFIHTLLSDLKAVKDLQMKESDNEFEFEIATQNEDKTGLPLQKIKIDKKTYHPISVALLDEAGEEKIVIEFSTVDFKTVHKKNEYTVEVATEEKTEPKEEDKTSTNEQTYYPGLEFANTKLVDEEKIEDDGVNRVILTFEGEKNYTLMQEPSRPNEQMLPVFAPGDIAHIGGTIGSMTENSLSWEENGKTFFLASKDLTLSEMIEVASSLTADSLK